MKIPPERISRVIIASVVPRLTPTYQGMAQKYFGVEALIVSHKLKLPITIAYDDPSEVGADRLVNGIAAWEAYGRARGMPLVVVDFGTATTFTAITRAGEFLGGNIIPGVRLSLEALVERTAKLPSVEIVPVENAIGRSTVESIQNGLFWSNVGTVKELVSRMTAEAFPDDPPFVVGTGGFSHLFANEGLFDAVVPDLILIGLREALRLNS